MTPPVLTYAIPFYRDLAFLRAALDTVRRQRDPRWVAVVVDDAGPEPEAADVVAAMGDPRITYRRNDRNLGLGGNWNRCLEVAPTDLVTIFHADDELEPTYGQTVLAALARHPRAVAVHTRARTIGPDGRPVFSAPDEAKRWIRPRHTGDLVSVGDHGLAAILKGDFVICPTMCFRRSVLGDRRFDPRWRMVVDLALLAELLLDGDVLVGAPQVAFRYRRHGASETSLLNASAERFGEELALYDEIAARAADRGWLRSARVGRRKRIVQLHLGYRLLGDLARGRWPAARTKLGLLGTSWRRPAPA